MLSNWVNGGGKLVAMRPDSQLAGLLGLTSVARHRSSNAYLQVDTQPPPGQGITDQTIQFHGTADHYQLSGAIERSRRSTATRPTATPFPAVTLRAVGSSGGQAAAFTYDLARSVVYTRQGNPAWSGQERDGQPPIRSDDLFFGASASDPQPDWVDLDKVAIPQADEQQRLLANLVLQMEQRADAAAAVLVPARAASKAVVVHDRRRPRQRWHRRPVRRADRRQPGRLQRRELGVHAQHVVRLPEHAADRRAGRGYTSQGFEVGAARHDRLRRLDAARRSRTSTTSQLAALARRSTRASPAPCTQPHALHRRERLLDPAARRARQRHPARHELLLLAADVGAGPSRAVHRLRDADALRRSRRHPSIDVYQAATQMTDESGQSYPDTIDTLLDNALGPLGYYGVFTANMHTDSASSSGADAIVASAQARNVPVVSRHARCSTGSTAATRRRSARSAWSGHVLTFSVTAGAAATASRRCCR